MQVVIYSTYHDGNWQPIAFENEEIKNICKLKAHCFVNKTDYLQPVYEQVGYAIVMDNTIDGCVKKIHELHGKIKGYKIDLQDEEVDSILNVIKKAKKEGINF